MAHNLSPAVYKRILEFQRAELNGSILYEHIARRQKDEKNKAALLEIAQAEREHYAVWKKYTEQDVRPNVMKIAFYRLLCRILGDTFTIKFFEQGENFGVRELREIEKYIPEAPALINDEEAHETRLLALLDEERLHYVGSMVLGLNDALVELKGQPCKRRISVAI